ncbi:MAG: hypothetical protein AAF658_04860 [Myxococcota bacterium]
MLGHRQRAVGRTTRCVPTIALGAVAAMLLVSVHARADAGDRNLELSGGYRTDDAADVLGGVRVGLSDFVSARALAGLRFDPDQLAGRLEISAGYAFDVLTWVPELSAGVAVDVDDVDVSLTGLAFVSVRRYVSRDAFLALELGGEITPDDEGLLLRLSFGF